MTAADSILAFSARAKPCLKGATPLTQEAVFCEEHLLVLTPDTVRTASEVLVTFLARERRTDTYEVSLDL